MPLGGINLKSAILTFSSWMKQDSVYQHVEREVRREKREHRPLQFCPFIRSKNISALAFISIMVSFFYEIKDSAYNTTDFCAFLLRLFDKFDQKGISNAVIIMDNVTLHK
jgi:flavodoxin